ncbi:I78 family peptidase inhibitor [Sphingomonas sp. Leaf62]|uniref:I78 family peptidase inhibitor n=1 Tax=Sphingomonas sp. Leaf62 TaxID=1736228 RepID=UPI0006F5585E|nr:I78 family peptidase inhibitor [Sphingomonas sp. Leaf62]KQN81910.1 hypothetical protein ASE91_00250 [Sphingomonas sp. Leaf62]
MKQFALMAVAMVGCAEPQTYTPPVAGPPVRTPPMIIGGRPVGPGPVGQIDSCGLGTIRDLVGKTVTQNMADDARKRSGTRTVRVIRPGTIVMMDFRQDRLNIDVDDKGIVTNLRCG